MATCASWALPAVPWPLRSALAAGVQCALEAIGCQHLTVARVVGGLGVAWNTVNNAVLAEGHWVLIADPDWFDGVKVIGVDEHVWRHTRRGDKYVCESRGGWSGTGCRRIGLALCLGVTQSTCGPRDRGALTVICPPGWGGRRRPRPTSVA